MLANKDVVLDGDFRYNGKMRFGFHRPADDPAVIPPRATFRKRVLLHSLRQTQAGIAAAALLWLGIGAGCPRVLADGVLAWGDNTYGQLGNGTSMNTSTVPVAVTGLSSGVSAISGGGYDGYAIQNGALEAWGYNAYGELGDGTFNERNAPSVVAGFESGVSALAGGSLHTIAVKSGAAYAWGRNSSGELGDGTTTDHYTPAPVTGLGSGVTAVAGGYSHNLAIQNGAAYAWGDNTYGQIGNNAVGTVEIPVAAAGLGSGVTAIAAGQYHSVAIKDGVIYTWGQGTYGQLGNGRTGSNLTPQPLTLSNTGSVMAIAAGQVHTLAVQNGNVYAWGYNTSGQLGTGPLSYSTTPLLVDPSDLQNIIAVAASRASSYALSSDGSLWVWGDNRYGELGLGTAVSQYNTPQHLLPPSGYRYTGIEADEYGYHVLAMLGQVPEPATWLGGALLIGFAMARRRAAARKPVPGWPHTIGRNRPTVS